MRGAHWAVIARIAQCQDGLITRGQAMASGVSRASFQRDVQFGRLIPVRRRVYRVAGVTLGPNHDVRAVTLAAPQVTASHQTAARLWGLAGARLARPLHFTASPRLRLELVGAVVHRSELAAEDQAQAAGIKVTSPARTIVDLGAVWRPHSVERVLHDAVMRKLCEYEDVAAALDRIGGRGRAGTAGLRRVLTGALGDTPLEARWHQRLVHAGLPKPVRQHQVVVGHQVFVLDFAWPHARVALEADGFAAHRTRAAFDRDRGKVLALRSAGWEVLSVTAQTPPAPVIDLLRRFIGENGLSR
jgi:hypothetical protein